MSQLEFLKKYFKQQQDLINFDDEILKKLVSVSDQIKKTHKMGLKFKLIDVHQAAL